MRPANAYWALPKGQAQCQALLLTLSHLTLTTTLRGREVLFSSPFYRWDHWGQGDLSKLSRATSSPPELLKIQQWCGQVLSRPGSAIAQICYILSGLSFPSWRECSHSRSSFPAWHSTACCCCCCCWRASLFPRSAALARPPPALPCFVFAAGPTTDALLAAQPRAQPRRLPLSLSSWPL